MPEAQLTRDFLTRPVVRLSYRGLRREPRSFSRKGAFRQQSRDQKWVSQAEEEGSNIADFNHGSGYGKYPQIIRLGVSGEDKKARP